MPSRLADRHATLVLDASVLVNLLGTNRAADVLRCLGRETLVVAQAAGEVRRDPSEGGPGDAALERLAGAGLLRVVRLGPEALATFSDLVGGAPPGGVLGDGEAATIAHAVASGATAVLDDKQAAQAALRLAPREPPLCTLDLLASPVVEAALGGDAVGELTYSALVGRARMRVPDEYKSWLVALLGWERLRSWQYLPKRWLR